MCAIEEAVTVDNIVPEIAFIICVVIFLVLDIILVTWNVLSWRLFLHRQCLTFLSWLLEAQWAILAFLLLGLSLIGRCLLRATLFIERLLEATELVIEVNKDVSA